MLAEVDGEQARLTPVSGLRPDGGLHLLTAQTADKHLLRPPFLVDGRRVATEGSFTFERTNPKAINNDLGATVRLWRGQHAGAAASLWCYGM